MHLKRNPHILMLYALDSQMDSTELNLKFRTVVQKPQT